MDPDELKRFLAALQRRERIEELGEAGLRITSGTHGPRDLHTLFFEWLQDGIVSDTQIRKAAAVLDPMPLEERLKALDVLTAAVHLVGSRLSDPQRELLLNYLLYFVYLARQVP